MSETWQQGSIYHAQNQTKGGYAVVRDTDQYYVEGTIFSRKKDALALSRGETPERKGKPISVSKYRWNILFTPGSR